MDQWVEVQVEEGVVKLLECPRCKAAVRTTVRYNGTINRTLQVVERVKQKLRGEVRTPVVVIITLIIVLPGHSRR